MNRGDHRQALLDDLSVETTDTFYATALLNRFIDRAVRAISNLHNWEQTQAAERQQLSLANDATDEYWNIPENWKTDSVYKVTVSTTQDGVGETYKLIIWPDYLIHKEDYTSSNKKIASDHKRQVFLSPRPTTDGVYLNIWGHEIPDALENDSDTHPFSDEQLLEEAIHNYALGLALRKARGSHYERGKQLINDAIALAETARDRQLNEQSKRKVEHTEMFEHTDFLLERGRRRTQRGSFETC